jgi:hypothetical protein
MTSNQIRTFVAIAILLATCASVLAEPEPGIALYQVGIENRPILTSGTYLGLANPNHNRLTLLYSHTYADTPWSNHFHRIGSYGYTGPADSPMVSLSTADRVPETYQLDNGLTLLPGSGVFSGKFVSGLGAAALPGDHVEQAYGALTVAPFDSLLAFDGLNHPDPLLEDPNPAIVGAKHAGHFLINASSAVYKNSVAGVRIGLELTAISPGLEITDAAGASLFSTVGDVLTLGDTGDWSLTPYFAVDGLTTLASAFSATFKLVDLSDTPQFGDSAPFSFDFVTVPEPTGIVLGIVAMGLAAIRRR